MRTPECAEWQAACEEQIQKLKDADAWKTVPLTKRKGNGHKILHGKWIFDTKTDNHGTILRYSPRWEVSGKRQRPGIDYDESYAPVALDHLVEWPNQGALLGPEQTGQPVYDWAIGEIVLRRCPRMVKINICVVYVKRNIPGNTA